MIISYEVVVIWKKASHKLFTIVQKSLRYDY